MICKLLPVSYPSLPSRDVQMTLPQVSVVNNRTSERILKKKYLKKKTLTITHAGLYCNLQGVFLKLTAHNLLSPRCLLE